MTDQSQPSPEVRALRQHQQDTAAAQTSVTQLEQAIAAQHAKAAKQRAKAAAIAELGTQREDLLADIATGQDKADELKALDARLAQQKKDLAEQGTQAAIEQTVAGLTRKLDRAQAELTTLQGRRPLLLRQLLRAQAEALGSEYVAAAFALKAVHQRLRGLASMLNDLGSVPAIFAGQGAVIEVPAPSLDTVKPHVDYINPNMLIAREFDNRHLLGLIDKEKAALRELGVDIS